jgi:hypothetical protein
MESTYTTPSGSLRCVKCGAENLSDAPHCWSCSEHDWREDDEDFAPPYPIALPLLRALLVTAGLLALGLLGLRRNLIPATVLLFIVVPTFVIDQAEALRCRRWGVPLSRRDRLVTVFKCALVLTPLVILASLAGMILYPVTH